VNKPALSPSKEPVHGHDFGAGGIAGFARNTTCREKPVR